MLDTDLVRRHNCCNPRKPGGSREELIQCSKKLEDAGYRASEKNRNSLNKTKRLGHEIDENRIKPNKKSENNHRFEATGISETIGIILRSNSFSRNVSNEIIGKNQKTATITKEEIKLNWGKEREDDFNNIKKLMTSNTTKTGLGITSWQKTIERRNETDSIREQNFE